MFRSPSPHLKIEFQGGEPLLNFPLIEVDRAKPSSMNEDHEAAHVRDRHEPGAARRSSPGLLRHEDVYISTSLDGPRTSTTVTGRGQATTAGSERSAGSAGPGSSGPDRVTALMTTTEASLDGPRDHRHLRRAGFHESSCGRLALRIRRADARLAQGYDVDRWLSFYEAGLTTSSTSTARRPDGREVCLDHAKKMLTNDDPGYVDLTSPAGIGIGALVYNYDGDVYASDEGRMLAEMGDQTFRLGNVHDSSFEDIMLSEQL